MTSEATTPGPSSAEEGSRGFPSLVRRGKGWLARGLGLATTPPHPSSVEEGSRRSPSSAEEGRPTLDRFAIPLLILFSVALYIVTTGYDLVGDDAILIGGNPYVQSFHFLRQIFTQNFWAFRGARGDSIYYRPLVMFTFLVQRMLFGPRPALFHLTNVLLNSWVVVMVYQLGKRLWPTGQGALWGALLFAALPVHSEDVATVSGISDVECAVFFLAAILIYTHPPGAKGFSRLRAWMSALVFLLAALSKEVALAAPLVMVFYEHFPRRDVATRFSQRLSRYLPSFLLAAFYVVVHLAVIGGISSVGPPNRMRLRETVIFGSTQLGEYVAKLIWPQHLSYSWKFYPPLSWRDPAMLMGMLFVLWSLGMVAAWWRRGRAVSFAIVWFFLTLAPVLNIAGVGVPAYGERYLYIPSVGICWLAGAALAAVQGQSPGLPRQRVRRLAAVACGTILLAAGTLRILVRLPAWRNNFTLGLATVRDDPTAAMFHVFLGNGYRQAGDRNRARNEYVAAIALDPSAGESFVNLAGVQLDDGNVDAGEDTLRRGAQLNPGFSKPLFALGKIALFRGDKEEARDFFERALALDPNDAEALLQLGLLSLREGRLAEAEELLRRDAIVQPSSSLVCLNLGAVFGREKRFALAEAEFQRAIQLTPQDEAPYLGLAGVYEDQGKLAEAFELYRQIVRSAPGSGNGQFRLGVLALKMGKKDDAIAALEKAIAIQPKSALAHAQLGLAYLDSGRRSDARREIEEARTLDPKDTAVQTAVTKLTTGR
jgi:protein O-mannosyl-transferase